MVVVIVVIVVIDNVEELDLKNSAASLQLHRLLPDRFIRAESISDDILEGYKTPG